MFVYSQFLMMYVTVLLGLFAALMTGSIAQYDAECVAGQQPEFPLSLVSCITCVSLDGLTLCNVGEIDCIWGQNPTDPSCAPPPTMAPMTTCHPEDMHPTYEPFIASLLGGQPCFACLNIYTLQRCLGTEGEICDWRGCSQEVSTVSEVTTSPPQQPCQPGDIAPVSADGKCWACLNNNTFQICRGGELEFCFWLECALEIVPNLICQPGSQLVIPMFPQCTLKCVNSDTNAPCVVGDVSCGWSNFNKSCLTMDTQTETAVTVKPCQDACSPGAEFVPIPDLFPDCKIDCRNVDTDELCAHGDRCCQFTHSNASCYGMPERPTTRMPEPVCQSEDTPPVPANIACYKCLSRNGGACVPNTYCEWVQVVDALCKSTEPTKVSSTRGSPHITLTTSVKDVRSKRKRFSVTFKQLSCKTIIGDDKHEEEFVRIFTQQIVDMLGTLPTDIKLSCGSTIVGFTLEQPTNVNLDDLAEKLQQEVKDGQFYVNFDGEEYSASAFEVIIRKSNPPPEKRHPLTYVFWFIVVGVIAVVIVAVFMIIVYLYLDYYCRQQSQQSPPKGSDNMAYMRDWEFKPNLSTSRSVDVTYFEENQSYGNGNI